MMTQHEAYKVYVSAVNRGYLVPANKCEICGGKNVGGLRNIVGHHWRGYDFPLDVWWICKTCNGRLVDWHDGKLSQDEAREFVKLSPKMRKVFTAMRLYRRSHP